MQTGNQSYEVTFILGEKATPEDAKTKVADLAAFLKQNNGSITKEEHWGRRDLAYEIKRNRSGIYTTIWIDYPSTGIKALEEHMRFDEGIIRSLVTKAYTTAQPGSLYPVVEEEKPERGARTPRTEDKSSAEEMLRRGAAAKPAKKSEESAENEDLPEEERLKKLDDSLQELLKDES